MQEDWSEDYVKCNYFAAAWDQTHANDGSWPTPEFKLLKGKLYFLEQLCVPTDRVIQVIDGHHRWNAHQGEDRLLPDLFLHYLFPTEVDVAETLAAIKRSCLVCQACHPPNWALKGPIVMTPVPARVMSSVCLDIPDLPEVEYRGKKFGAFVICVDRHSGWIIARPATRQITGKEAAQLLLDSSWGEMGVPSIITCDRGPQFISEWWETMCVRLGIRLAFSQAYRPNTNGRAEAAVRVVQDTLRKMHTQSAVSWVEALPRVLRIQHDTRDPVMGCSPYQVVFGRHRALAALPYEYPEMGEEPEEYFQRMAELDEAIAQKLNEHHQRIEDAVNARRKGRPAYREGDWVWFLKTKPVGGVKMGTWWMDPFRILERIGESTYKIKDTHNKTHEAHAQSLKPYVWDMPQQPILTMEIPPIIPAAESGVDEL